MASVGDKVETGQVLAKLDPQDELNVLRSTEATFAAAQAQQRNASATFDRQRELLAAGHTPRAQFDQALRELKVAEARVDEVAAQVKNQALRVAWTSLQADAPGTISAVGAEPGEVVQVGQMIVRVARSGGRDAVFDMPARLIREAPPDVSIMVRLSDDPSVLAEGRVREVAAQADPLTRTFEVKVGLTAPPPTMRLGSSVTGSLELASDPAIMLPASVLTSSNGQPAVWIVDPASLTVSLRNIEFRRFDSDTVLIARGIETGDIVVTAGVHALHPGQRIRLLEKSS
jgi:RND family efflux transporter MFP subunit